MHSDPRGDFPRVIDNTIRTLFVSCPRKFYWRISRGLVAGDKSIHLHAGAAFAKGLEGFRLSYWGDAPGDYERALLEGFRALTKAYGYDPEWEAVALEKSAKSYTRIATAYLAYWDRFHPDRDRLRPFIHQGRPAVEFNFSVPLPIPHPQTGEPLIYTGRFDLLGEYMGALWAVDEKTTSAMGATWSRQWELRSQFTGYCWGAQQYGLPVAGALVRGVSVQKEQIKFGEAPVYQPEWKINRWYEQLLSDIRRMVRAWDSNQWDYNLSDSCASFAGCQYLSLCTKPNPETWIEGSYTVHPWDPTLGQHDKEDD